MGTLESVPLRSVGQEPIVMDGVMGPSMKAEHKRVTGLISHLLNPISGVMGPYLQLVGADFVKIGYK